MRTAYPRLAKTCALPSRSWRVVRSRYGGSSQVRLPQVTFESATTAVRFILELLTPSTPERFRCAGDLPRSFPRRAGRRPHSHRFTTRLVGDAVAAGEVRPGPVDRGTRRRPRIGARPLHLQPVCGEDLGQDDQAAEARGSANAERI